VSGIGLTHSGTREGHNALKSLSMRIIYIIKIGRSVCGQLCDWSARSAGLACAQRGPVKPKTSVASFRLVTITYSGPIHYSERIEDIRLTNPDSDT